MKRGLLLFSMLLIMSLLVGCTTDDLGVRATVSDFKTLQSFPILSVNNFNGNVTLIPVTEKEQEGVFVEKVAFGTDKEQMEVFLQNKVDVIVEEKNLTAEITSTKDFTSLPEGIKSVAVNLTIKIASDVNDVTVITNGSVTTDKFNGDLDVDTANGDIIVTNGSGEAYLTNKNNGLIEVSSFSGMIIANTENGLIDVKTNNTISYVFLETKNGDLSFESSKKQTGNYNLECINGYIEVSLPANNGLNISAETLNGTIWCDYNKKSTINGPYEEIIGNGEADLNLSTVNGDIDISIAF